jgi:hypothetical protein
VQVELIFSGEIARVGMGTPQQDGQFVLDTAVPVWVEFRHDWAQGSK